MGDNIYNKNFYDAQSEMSRKSANVVLKELFKIIKPNSIADIGCGRGTWLNAAFELGVNGLVGVEGEWVSQDDLVCDKIKLYHNNFSKNPDCNLNFPKVDLCICLEVAEHLPKSSADKFIKYLTKTSDVILFSAAIPGQGGVNHVNEQWQSYWAEKFKMLDFSLNDILRGKVWRNSNVRWWYKQNIIVYTKKGCEITLHADSHILDIVHPENYSNTIEYKKIYSEPKIKYIVSIVISWLSNLLKAKKHYFRKK